MEYVYDIYDSPRKPEKGCLFSRISSCSRDHHEQMAPNPYLCNDHGKMFGLRHEFVSIVDGSNHRQKRVHVYAVGHYPFKIPMLTNIYEKDIIYLPEILGYVDKLQNQSSGVCKFNTTEMTSFIACLLGLTEPTFKLQFPQFELPRGWLSRPGSKIILINAEGTISMEDSLNVPFFHRLLLDKIMPAFVAPNNAAIDVSAHYHCHNVILSCSDNNNFPSFQFSAPQLVYKYSEDDKYTYPTPLILSGGAYAYEAGVSKTYVNTTAFRSNAFCGPNNY